MAATPSNMLALGTIAPDFSLLEPLTGRTRTLAEFGSASALVVAFICNHCPYVIHLRQALIEFARDFVDQGGAMVAISSNDAVKYPQDGPERMAEEARHFKYPFPYLYDASQEVARAYQAACTPDFYLFNADRRLVYRGQFDETRPNGGKAPHGTDLRRAVQALLAGESVSIDQKPSLGCNIKWK